jgi:2-polyprenyl-3-methyl-5-hydroxy-6-metoxy-1,4-benzoquinol methylase
MINLYQDKPASYYSVVRNEIVDLIPPGTKHLLDIGCGTGGTAFAAKKKLGIKEVIGIEFFQDSAVEASKLLDKVLICDIEQDTIDLPTNYFDCIVLADVLEHTKNPWEVLSTVKKFLTEDGIIIVSLPHIGHIGPVLKILFDKLDYDESGIMDKTHLKIFTKHTMKALFRQAGLRIIKESCNYSNSLKFRLLNMVTFNLLFRFSVYQYIFQLKKVS